MASAVGQEEIGSHISEVGIDTKMKFEAKKGCNISEYSPDQIENDSIIIWTDNFAKHN